MKIMSYGGRISHGPSFSQAAAAASASSSAASASASDALRAGQLAPANRLSSVPAASAIAGAAHLDEAIAASDAAFVPRQQRAASLSNRPLTRASQERTVGKVASKVAERLVDQEKSVPSNLKALIRNAIQTRLFNAQYLHSKAGAGDYSDHSRALYIQLLVEWSAIAQLKEQDYDIPTTAPAFKSLRERTRAVVGNQNLGRQEECIQALLTALESAQKEAARKAQVHVLEGMDEEEHERQLDLLVNDVLTAIEQNTMPTVGVSAAQVVAVSKDIRDKTQLPTEADSKSLYDRLIEVVQNSRQQSPEKQTRWVNALRETFYQPGENGAPSPFQRNVSKQMEVIYAELKHRTDAIDKVLEPSCCSWFKACFPWTNYAKTLARVKAVQQTGLTEEQAIQRLALASMDPSFGALLNNRDLVVDQVIKSHCEAKIQASADEYFVKISEPNDLRYVVYVVDHILNACSELASGYLLSDAPFEERISVYLPPRPANAARARSASYPPLSPSSPSMNRSASVSRSSSSVAAVNPAPLEEPVPQSYAGRLEHHIQAKVNGYLARHAAANPPAFRERLHQAYSIVTESHLLERFHQFVRPVNSERPPTDEAKKWNHAFQTSAKLIFRWRSFLAQSQESRSSLEQVTQESHLRDETVRYLLGSSKPYPASQYNMLTLERKRSAELFTILVKEQELLKAHWAQGQLQELNDRSADGTSNLLLVQALTANESVAELQKHLKDVFMAFQRDLGVWFNSSAENQALDAEIKEAEENFFKLFIKEHQQQVLQRQGSVSALGRRIYRTNNAESVANYYGPRELDRARRGTGPYSNLWPQVEAIKHQEFARMIPFLPFMNTCGSEAFMAATPTREYYEQAAQFYADRGIELIN